jgi:hypothetical protein
LPKLNLTGRTWCCRQKLNVICFVDFCKRKRYEWVWLKWCIKWLPNQTASRCQLDLVFKAVWHLLSYHKDG